MGARRWVVGGAAIAIGVAVATTAVIALGATSSDGAPATVTFDGQSLNNTPFEGPTFPMMVMDGRVEPWANVSWNGISWTRLEPSIPSRLVPRATDGADTLVMNGGTSDLDGEGDSGAQLYADEVAYARSARAAGFERIVILTLSPSGRFDDAAEAARIEHNGLLLDDPEDAFDDVVDVAAIPGLGDPSDQTYYLDGTHWTAAAAELAAGAVRQAL